MYQEQLINNIPLSNNFKSNGYLLTRDVDSKNTTSKIILSLHGLSGTSKNYITLKTRDYIVDNNLDYDLFRFDFYNNSEDHRTFLNTTIASQIDDLNSIINYFANKYDEIYIMAASYGGLTAAALNSDKITKQVLIDPSFIIDIQWQHANNITLTGGELASFEYHVPMLLNPAMQVEGLEWSALKSQAILNNINKPSLIIQANSIHYKLCANLDYSNPNITTEYFKDADHSFTLSNYCNKMLEYSFNFLK